MKFRFAICDKPGCEYHQVKVTTHQVTTHAHFWGGETMVENGTGDFSPRGKTRAEHVLTVLNIVGFHGLRASDEDNRVLQKAIDECRLPPSFDEETKDGERFAMKYFPEAKGKPAAVPN